MMSKPKMAERKIYFIMFGLRAATRGSLVFLSDHGKGREELALNYEAASRPGKVDNKAEMRGEVLMQEIKCNRPVIF
ncbi:hypothetical protein ACE6H2_026105 [Prunus campanulata]